MQDLQDEWRDPEKDPEGRIQEGRIPLADSDRKQFQIRLELKKYVHNKAWSIAETVAHITSCVNNDMGTEVLRFRQ